MPTDTEFMYGMYVYCTHLEGVMDMGSVPGQTRARSCGKCPHGRGVSGFARGGRGFGKRSDEGLCSLPEFMDFELCVQATGFCLFVATWDTNVINCRVDLCFCWFFVEICWLNWPRMLSSQKEINRDGYCHFFQTTYMFM